MKDAVLRDAGIVADTAPLHIGALAGLEGEQQGTKHRVKAHDGDEQGGRGEKSPARHALFGFQTGFLADTPGVGR